MKEIRRRVLKDLLHGSDCDLLRRKYDLELDEENAKILIKHKEQ